MPPNSLFPSNRLLLDTETESPTSSTPAAFPKINSNSVVPQLVSRVFLSLRLRTSSSARTSPLLALQPLLSKDSPVAPALPLAALLLLDLSKVARPRPECTART